MTVEIERKFLVVGDGWRSSVTESRSIRQAYIAKNERLSIRIRIDDNAVSTLTIKTAASGIARDEYEYQIPGADAEELMHQREGVVVSKVRHIVPVGELIWEIDEFEEENSGLVIAEIELDRADQSIGSPEWLGDEVTNDRRYYNSELARFPRSVWDPSKD